MPTRSAGAVWHCRALCGSKLIAGHSTPSSPLFEIPHQHLGSPEPWHSSTRAGDPQLRARPARLPTSRGWPGLNHEISPRDLRAVIKQTEGERNSPVQHIQQKNAHAKWGDIQIFSAKIGPYRGEIDFWHPWTIANHSKYQKMCLSAFFF